MKKIQEKALWLPGTENLNNFLMRRENFKSIISEAQSYSEPVIDDSFTHKRNVVIYNILLLNIFFYINYYLILKNNRYISICIYKFIFCVIQMLRNLSQSSRESVNILQLNRPRNFKLEAFRVTCRIHC